MHLTFYLHCNTRWGENAYLLLADEAIPMKYFSDSQWKLTVDLQKRERISYSYVLKYEDGQLLVESKLKRHLALNTQNEHVEIYDDFVEESNVFQTLPFQNCFFLHKKVQKTAANQWLLQVYVPFVEKKYSVGILGSSSALGGWMHNNYLPMNYLGNGWWSTAVEPQGVVEYKFIIVDEFKNIVLWEDGNNRISDFRVKTGTSSVLNLIFKHNFHWKGAGVAIPVFSLRSASDWGIGTYTDLHLLADWASNIGLKFIQILPINDTTNKGTNADSYPYRAVSIYALHPILLDVKKIGTLNDIAQQKMFERRGLQLNEKTDVSYSEVFALKTAYLKLVYEQDARDLFRSAAYKKFLQKNRHWLLPYAVYSCLRDEYRTTDFNSWKEYSAYSLSKINDYVARNEKRVGYYCFVQYYADKQLKEAHAYATQKGIALKGDLPIGISADSVDAWMNPSLFHLDAQAGAPPDDFSINGQNWGFPTYNWEKMKSNGFDWWKSRFRNMAEYFDAYRIDHILGFFRIWSIPIDSSDGILGYFNPALPLSQEEIKQKGLFLSEKMFCPFITKHRLTDTFGEDAHSLADTFFDHQGDVFIFKSKFATQNRLINYFKQYPHLVSPEKQRKLLDVYTNVLFIKDRECSNAYHPRIMPFDTESFKCLTEEQQECFRMIHDDYFYVRHNEFWKKQALLKLPSLLNTNEMLVCGEDLGMIPTCVPDVMNLLRILTLEVQRMPKQMDLEFVVSSRTPYLSVYTTGTHDTSTLREWWQENLEKTQHYYNSVLNKTGTAPDFCNPEIVQCVLKNVFSANSMLTILPLQDFLALKKNFVTENPTKERINNPANPHHYWCYRMSVNLETLLKENTFNLMLKNLLVESGRN